MCVCVYVQRAPTLGAKILGLRRRVWLQLSPAAAFRVPFTVEGSTIATERRLGVANVMVECEKVPAEPGQHRPIFEEDHWLHQQVFQL